MSRERCDALVIGAGPAGAASAILLAQAGWRVMLVEQHAYPRRKVCGECIAAGNLPLLDALGVGAQFRAAAGPELRRIGWMDGTATVLADMPRCAGPDPFGRALGRDRLDALLVRRATDVGVQVRQPARVLRVNGELGGFECTLADPGGSAARAREWTASAAVVIDAHGSWERAPEGGPHTGLRPPPAARNAADLFAFKANFRGTALPHGLLPVLSLPGGYGGMVVEDDGLLTIACCLRRDTLAACRAAAPGASAGDAVQAFLRRSCAGVDRVLESAVRSGAWLAVGPLQPGIRVNGARAAFRVGNAAGESHALIGEGITMALQGAALLAEVLRPVPVAAIGGRSGARLHREYSAAWRRTFARRLRLAAIYAHIAMRPGLAIPARVLLGRWPALLGVAARLAGKASRGAPSSLTAAESA